jgi:hypothetical protein
MSAGFWHLLAPRDAGNRYAATARRQPAMLEEVPVEVMNQVTGYVFLAEQTPEFIARNLVSHLRHYAASLKTPFFGRLVDYAEEGNQLWTCPGHNGGAFYARSPIGRIFVAHLGEAVFRDDLDNSILELGDLLTHEGPALEAQKAAAQIFGAERTYFVLNGTSASNKVVLSALIAKGDLVLFNRNKSQGGTPRCLLHGRRNPDFPGDSAQLPRPDRSDRPRCARRGADPRGDSRQSACHGPGGMATRTAVPCRGDRAMHLRRDHL